MPQPTATQVAPAPQDAQTPAIRIDAGPANVAQTIALPRNVQEIAGLRARRSELSDQLSRAWNRREDVTDEMLEASGVERAGLEQRLAVIDGRIVQIEADIAATERALTNAPSGLLGAEARAEAAAEAALEASRPPIDDEVVGAIGIMGMILLVPIVIARARRIWKTPQVPRSMPVAAEGRLERIEQAVEAIAVEVERVSEGQRFVTRLMSEGKPVPALQNKPSSQP